MAQRSTSLPCRGGHLASQSIQTSQSNPKADIHQGLMDQIVVYKIDRLTRSLADFAKTVDRLESADASFVSVNQSFRPELRRNRG